MGKESFGLGMVMLAGMNVGFSAHKNPKIFRTIFIILLTIKNNT